MILKCQIVIKRDILILRLQGELDQNSVGDVKSRVCDLIEKYKIRYLVLNLKELDFMDSSGIGFIIGRYNSLKYLGGEVILCNMNEQIKRIVILSGLTRITRILHSEEQVNSYLEGMVR